MTTKTRTPKTPSTALAPVIAGPPATRHPRDGRVLGLTPSTYPEVSDSPEDGVHLWCTACRELHPAKKFNFLVRRGSGKGRMAECRAAWSRRLAESKALAAEGKPRLPAPHLDAAHVVPKPKPAAKAAPGKGKGKGRTPAASPAPADQEVATA